MKFIENVSKELLLLIVLAIVIVLPIRIFLAQPFVVEGESMFPTFKNLDYLIVDELTYRFEAPERGEVVVFRYPNDPKIFYIKRIIGLPGETLRITRGKVDITKTDGTKLTLEEPYVIAEDATYSGTTTLGPDQYFVMGDNRPKSSDSRVWGALPRENIAGRAFLRVLPPTSLALLPGAIALPQ
ncbi:MAG: signal peptidase I [Parcubacteria bacterium C7867-001]|nr:MAG: signal peptidase I [Parcubacteria bacterium C7867-001]